MPNIDSKVMFNRMIAVTEREESLEQFFEYELTSEPMSIFRGGMMRKPDKPSLCKVLLPDSESLTLDKIDRKVISVVDGGALLHKVRWKKGMKFSEIGNVYVHYVKMHYEKAVIVFDGYEDESMKRHEHLRRNSVPQSIFAKVDTNYLAPFTEDRYLSWTENKVEFIKFISNLLRQYDFKVTNCSGDADSTIVATSPEFTSQRTGPVNIIADDTDIVIMLMHHWKTDIHDDVDFVQERFSKAWSVQSANQSIEDIKDDLLFLHAWSGCDTTSSIFGKGKGNLLTILRKSPSLKEKSAIINNAWSSQNEVGEASIAAFKILYGGNENAPLSLLRYIFKQCSDKALYFSLFLIIIFSANNKQF